MAVLMNRGAARGAARGMLSTRTRPFVFMDPLRPMPLDLSTLPTAPETRPTRAEGIAA
jgi:hypothetical protein